MNGLWLRFGVANKLSAERVISMEKPYQLLLCPIEGGSLTLSERTLKCDAGHCYDIARDGYVNLLPVQNKRSRDPGDSKEMIASRRRFLNSGIYEEIAHAATAAVHKGISPLEPTVILDAGCGEGYYLRHLVESSSQYRLNAIGVDISKWAVLSAAKQDPSSLWLVGSNAKLPIASESLDRILCMFGFPVYEEFSRTLKSGGKLILIEPGPEHLQELRAIIYSEVKAKPKHGEDSLPEFTQVSHDTLKFTVHLSEKSQVSDLLIMTPHLYRASAEGKAAAAALEHLTLTIDVQIKTLAKI